MGRTSNGGTGEAGDTPDAETGSGPVPSSDSSGESSGSRASRGGSSGGGATGGGDNGRFGRDIVAAVGVGVVLVGLLVVSLIFSRAVFVVLAVVLVGVAVVELTQALRPTGVRLPLVPLLAGTAVMLVGAYNDGTEALSVVAGLTIVVLAFVRLMSGREGFVRDVTAGVFVTMYVPFLAGFAVLMLRPADGPLRVALFVAVTIMSDIGGYAAGVLVGRHKLAPQISPGKTWEGLAGSAIACLAVGWLGVAYLLKGPWWAGLLLGAAVTVTATFGDLVESMIKRDVGIKDMGNLLPGHGGIMDRLDSLLPSALASWLVLTACVPVVLR